jgi:hypothetical protein
LPPSTQPNPRPRQYRGADDSADLLDETAEASKATIAYVKKVQNNLLTYDEAIGELTRQIKARGLGLTETLRARDVIGTNKTAADHYARRLRANRRTDCPVDAGQVAGGRRSVRRVR